MEPDFWHAKWRNRETGFHLSAPHPLLCKYYASVLANSKQIFVPLCGKTIDLVFLAEQGKTVFANELSQIAVSQFFEEILPLSAAQSLAEPFDSNQSHHNQDPHTEAITESITRYAAGQISIYQGNYFELISDWLAGCDGVYDRAALIAMPPSMQLGYVQQLQKLLPKAILLLITLEYPQAEMSGPPFAVDELQVRQLFNFAKVTHLYRQDILAKEPRFKEKGLSAFYESAYCIEW